MLSKAISTLLSNASPPHWPCSPAMREARRALYRAYAGKMTVPLFVVGLIASAAVVAAIRHLRRRVLRDRAKRFMEEGILVRRSPPTNVCCS